MASLRASLTSLTTLAVFLTVNVCVGALHHHAPAGHSSSHAASLEDGSTCLTGATCDEDGNDCPICKCLHVVKAVPEPTTAVVMMPDSGAVLFPGSSLAGHEREPIAHSRAPPAV